MDHIKNSPEPIHSKPKKISVWVLSMDLGMHPEPKKLDFYTKPKKFGYGFRVKRKFFGV